MAQRKPKHPPRKLHIRVRHVVLAAFLLIALYVIVPQAGQIGKAFDVAWQADAWLVVAAALAIAVAIASAAMVYVWLALKPIRYRDSLVVQTAGMFVNRLLPAGIGSMGLVADFLYRHKHTLPKASAIVVLNNVITFAGHMALLVAFALLLDTSLPEIRLPGLQTVHLVIVVACLVGVGTLLQTKLFSVLSKFMRDVGASFRLHAKRKKRVAVAGFFALGNTLGHAGAIYLTMLAFGLDLSFVVALFVLTGGVAVASVTPTPGGLIGSEAGLTAVLVSYGVDTATALAVAVSYRLVSYWLPLVPGVCAFWYAQKKRLI